MEKGFNSDVEVRGKRFHVQTEDWGQDKSFIVSTVFLNGAVIKTFKTSYTQIFTEGSVRTIEAIRLALRRQHHDVIEKLNSII